MLEQYRVAPRVQGRAIDPLQNPVKTVPEWSEGILAASAP